MSTMRINRNLIWDYDVPPPKRRDAYFKRWYIARVLTRGGPKDLRAIGKKAIRAYLPILDIPERIRRFWEWYFQNPHHDRRSRHSHAIPDRRS